MKIMRKQAVCIAFCAIFLTAVFATSSPPDNSLVKETFENDCSTDELFLNFSNTTLTRIGQSFINSPLIKCLNLKGNEILEVDKDAFDGLPALEYLNMAENRLQDVISFNGHKNLKVFLLAKQNPDEIYYYNNRKWIISGNYQQLRYLDLSYNRINTIDMTPEDIQENIVFPALTYLDLSYNAIRKFTPNFYVPWLFGRNLTHLYLHQNNIENADFTTLTNLIVLTLDNNNIINLQRRYCDVYSACFADMPRLKYLSVSNNRLNTLDLYFFNSMPGLVTLNLNNNELRDGLWQVFDELPFLENLNIDNNKLTNISMSGKLLKLSNFSLNWNNIKYIDSGDLKSAPNLRKLYLNHNNIEGIHKNAFSALKLLEELHLANNNLMDLPAEWCSNLKSLRYLNLTNNMFTDLESISLDKTLPLIDLDLINNQLINIKTKVMRDLPKNVTIHLIQWKKKVDSTSVCHDC